jgi:hypothetical protein
LLKVPSKFVPGEEEYKGPILFNPGTLLRTPVLESRGLPGLYHAGGPGGSGVSVVALSIGPNLMCFVPQVDFMRLLGDGLRGLLGDGYDLVGFDPR